MTPSQRATAESVRLIDSLRQTHRPSRRVEAGQTPVSQTVQRTLPDRHIESSGIENRRCDRFARTIFALMVPPGILQRFPILFPKVRWITIGHPRFSQRLHVALGIGFRSVKRIQKTVPATHEHQRFSTGHTVAGRRPTAVQQALPDPLIVFRDQPTRPHVQHHQHGRVGPGRPRMFLVQTVRRVHVEQTVYQQGRACTRIVRRAVQTFHKIEPPNNVTVAGLQCGTGSIHPHVRQLVRERPIVAVGLAGAVQTQHVSPVADHKDAVAMHQRPGAHPTAELVEVIGCLDAPPCCAESAGSTRFGCVARSKQTTAPPPLG